MKLTEFELFKKTLIYPLIYLLVFMFFYTKKFSSANNLTYPLDINLISIGVSIFTVLVVVVVVTLLYKLGYFKSFTRKNVKVQTKVIISYVTFLTGVAIVLLYFYFSL